MPDSVTLAPANGMDPEVFEAFLEQLQRFVRERLVPAEEQTLADNRVADEVDADMRQMLRAEGFGI